MTLDEILVPREKYTKEGLFFTAEAMSGGAPPNGGTRFSYEQIDPKSRVFQMLFGNVDGSDVCTTAIKTKRRLGYKVRDVLVLQDGTAYSVASVAVDYGANAKNAQAFRYRPNPPGIDYVLRLIEIDNPWKV